MKKPLICKKIEAVIFLFLFCNFLINAETSRGSDLLSSGLEKFKKELYSQAMQDFRDIVLNSSLVNLHGDAYFWISKSYLALGQLDDAAKNLEYFLMNFKNNPNYSEAFYQKGRLLYLQGDYENAIQVLTSYVDYYKDTPFTANSYYWIGESLYALGHFNEALEIFKIVVQKYPTSYKVEAAKYRISLIELESREQELLKFLKWSHEESLKTLEEFQRREQTYTQALAAYQKKLASYADAGTAKQIEELTVSLKQKEDEITSLNNQVNSLKSQLSRLKQESEQLKAQLATATTTTEPAKEVQVVTDKSLENKMRLMTLKEKALNLREFYLSWLEKRQESK
ncbi:MAG: tetratricopeptide repeat protein [Spirochaetota bacterium]